MLAFDDVFGEARPGSNVEAPGPRSEGATPAVVASLSGDGLPAVRSRSGSIVRRRAGVRLSPVGDALAYTEVPGGAAGHASNATDGDDDDDAAGSTPVGWRSVAAVTADLIGAVEQGDVIAIAAMATSERYFPQVCSEAARCLVCSGPRRKAECSVLCVTICTMGCHAGGWFAVMAQSVSDFFTLSFAHCRCDRRSTASTGEPSKHLWSARQRWAWSTW